jgi:transcription elongation GreA/GreB family factor
MAVSRTTRSLIERGDFDALEDEWLARAAEDEIDLDYFVGAARALAGQGEEARARLLLELLDGQLAERGSWAERLALLRRAGTLLLDEAALHPAILDTLGRLHPESPSFGGLAEAVGLHRAVHDLDKTWEKADRLRELLRYEIGTAVVMEGRGAGRVEEVNFALASFKVTFAESAPLNVGFRAAGKLLEPLPAGHFLLRKLEAPAELAALGRDDPPELLRLVLESAGRPLTAGEIRQQVAGLVGEEAWTSWWAAARRHPQVVAGRGGRQTYSWAASSGDALDAVRGAFDAAAPREKIALLRRDAARDPANKEQMAAALAALGAAAAESDPGLAFEIFCGLEREGALPAGDPDALPFAPARLVARPGGLKPLFSGIEDRAVRERAYRTVRERRADWRELFVDALEGEDDPRALDLVTAELAAAGERGLERFLDGTLAQPHRAPAAFAWLAERAGDDEALARRNPLRLLQQILVALGRDEFAAQRARLRKLVVAGGTVPKLFRLLAEDQAPAAAEAIHRAARLEPHERADLATALELRFPSLRERAGAPAAGSQVLWATAESIAAKRAELDRLTREELPANRKAIEEARAHGDLRENFEYKAARQRHEVLSALATRLDRDLRRAQPIDFAAIDPSQVRVGTRVTLRSAAGAERAVTVLGPWESAPEAGVVSYESELAAALLGKAPGGFAEAGGERWEVVAVERAR